MECDPTGDRKTINERCVKAEVRAYPTWYIGGQKYEGVMSLDQLGDLSKFRYSTQLEPKS